MIVDYYDNEVKSGDYICLGWFTPFGGFHGTFQDEQIQLTVDFECLGVNILGEFHPITDYLIKEKGEYIPNYGQQEITTNKGYFKLCKIK